MKRLNIPTFEHKSVAPEITQAIQPWREVYKDKRTFYHYLGNTILSVKFDVAREGLELLDRFHAATLPVYEPDYLWVNKDPIPPGVSLNVGNGAYTNISNFDKFFANVFNSLERETLDKIDLNGAVPVSGFPITDNILRLVGSEGDVFDYEVSSKTIGNTSPAGFRNLAVQTLQVADTQYAFIPGAIKIRSLIDYLGTAIEEFEIIEIDKTTGYENAYDINNNGIIDDEDIAFFEASEGSHYEKTPIDDWNNIYRHMDTNNDGIIGAYEINIAQRLLFVAFQKGTLIKIKSRLPAFTVSYVSVPSPEISQLHKIDDNIITVRSNTLGSKILLDDIVDQPGIYQSTFLTNSNHIIEIDSERNVNIVFLDGLNTYRMKISWLNAHDWLPVGLTNIDDIVLITTRSRTTFTYRVYAFDMRKEAVEYSDAFYNLDIPADHIFSFAYTSEKPNRYIAFTTSPNGEVFMFRYLMAKKYFHFDTATKVLTVSEKTSVTYTPLALTSGAEAGVFNIPLVPRSVQNSIDDYAYDWGIERIPGELNQILKNRILDFWRHLQGNDHIGMVYGIGKDLFILPENIESTLPNEKYTLKLFSTYTGKKPVRLIIVDDNKRELHLFAFKNYQDLSIPFQTKFILTGLVKPNGNTIEIPDNVVSYKPLFSPGTFDSNNMLIVPNEDPSTGSWDFINEDLGLPDSIEIQNDTISFANAPNIIRNYSGFRIFVFYDTVDPSGNYHGSNYDELFLPRFKLPEDEQKNKIIIEDLLHTGSYRSRWIDNLTNREALIANLRALDNSKWNQTEISISYFDAGIQSGTILKENKWSGLSFNKTFSASTGATWRY